MRTNAILYGMMLLPGLAWADEAKPGPAAGAQTPARAGSPAESGGADLEKFRSAMNAIHASSEKNEILAGMETLRNGYPGSRPVLLETIQTGNVRSRSFALQVLGEKGKASEDMSILVPCLKDSNHRVRLAASMAIRRLGKEQGGLEAILDYLPGEVDANNRKMAIKTLQQWRDRAALNVFVAMLETEKDKGVRNFLVTALEFITREKYGEDAAAWRSYLESQASQEQARQLLQKKEKEVSR